MNILNKIAKLIVVIGFSSPVVQAEILVWPGTAEFSAYGKAGWTTMTAMLDASSGNTMITVSNFSNSAQVMASDSLWLGLGPETAALTPNEVLNIQNFVATGKRVVLLGEHAFWGEWNSQITGLLGGSFEGDDFDGGAHPAITHELTSGITSIDVPSGGVPLGGTSLFTQGYAALYGPSENALVLLDVNTFSDDYIGSLDNAVFAQNVADWIAVPEPGSVGLLGLGSGILLFARRQRRRRATIVPHLKKSSACDSFEIQDNPMPAGSTDDYFWKFVDGFSSMTERFRQTLLRGFDAFLALIIR